jgi:hypothetical protein
MFNFGKYKKNLIQVQVIEWFLGFFFFGKKMKFYYKGACWCG